METAKFFDVIEGGLNCPTSIITTSGEKITGTLMQVTDEYIVIETDEKNPYCDKTYRFVRNQFIEQLLN